MACARQAALSLEQALGDGQTRIALDIQNFRQTSPAILKPLVSRLPTPFVAIFGTGNAGLGEIEWGKGPWTLLDSGDALDYVARVPWELMLVMDASSIENAPMQRFWQVAGSKPLVMMNSWPEAPGVVGLGRGREKDRMALREKITVAYYLQALRFQPIAICRAYPGPWQLWLTQEAQPQLLLEQEQPFSANQLKPVLAKQPGVPLVERLQAFWNGPRYFRGWN